MKQKIKRIMAMLLCMAALLCLSACGGEGAQTPSEAPVETAAPTATPTASPEATATPTPTPTPSPTAEPTPEPTPEATAAPTPAPTPKATAAPTPQPSKNDDQSLNLSQNAPKVETKVVGEDQYNDPDWASKKYGVYDPSELEGIGGDPLILEARTEEEHEADGFHKALEEISE